MEKSIQRTRALSVNLDHIATLRQQRLTRYPELATAAGICEVAGAEGITLHLRGDRRHIQDRDVELIREVSLLPLTLEMAATSEMMDFALRVRPDCITIVPERASELTTEGGLNASGLKDTLKDGVHKLLGIHSEVCLFLEPDVHQIDVARELGCHSVEIHTGKYADLLEKRERDAAKIELKRIQEAVLHGHSLGLKMNAGHGLHYQNIQPLAAIPELCEFSIGHAIVGRAIFTGLKEAVSEMVRLIQ
jgi:pyridoxine 5-phosphate synthase